MESLLFALIFVALGAVLGFGVACIALAAIMVRAALRDQISATAEQLADVTTAAARSMGPGVSVASPGGELAHRDPSGLAESATAAKTRQKPRCALCESIRRALKLGGRDLARKNPV